MWKFRLWARKNKIIVVYVVVFALAAFIYFLPSIIRKDWPTAYKAEFDKFFGEGNWSVVSDEILEEIRADKPYYFDDVLQGAKYHGEYQQWNIQYKDKDNNEHVWKITDIGQRSHNQHLLIFFPDYMSDKEALINEFVETAHYVAGEQVRDNVLEKVLSKEQSNSLDSYVFYMVYLPDSNLGEKLWEQDWFNIKTISAKDILQSELAESQIRILANKGRLLDLPVAQQQEVRESAEDIARRIEDEYGVNTTYEVIIDVDHKAYSD